MLTQPLGHSAIVLQYQAFELKMPDPIEPTKWQQVVDWGTRLRGSGLRDEHGNWQTSFYGQKAINTRKLSSNMK